MGLAFRSPGRRRGVIPNMFSPHFHARSFAFRLCFEVTSLVKQDLGLHSLADCVEVLRIASLPVTSVVINLA